MNSFKQAAFVVSILLGSHQQVSATEPDESTLIKYTGPTYSGIKERKAVVGACSGAATNLATPQDTTVTTNWKETAPCSCFVSDPAQKDEEAEVRIDLGAIYSVTHIAYLAAGGTGGYVEADSMTGIKRYSRVKTIDVWTNLGGVIASSADGAWTTEEFARDARYISLTSLSTGKSFELCGIKVYGTPSSAADWAVLVDAVVAQGSAAETETQECQAAKSLVQDEFSKKDTENKKCQSDKKEVETKVVGGDNCKYKLFGRYWFCQTPKEEE